MAGVDFNSDFAMGFVAFWALAAGLALLVGLCQIARWLLGLLVEWVDRHVHGRRAAARGDELAARRLAREKSCAPSGQGRGAVRRRRDRDRRHGGRT